MTIQQVGVFLDNRPGSLSELMGHLEKAKLRVFALSIAEAGEFGVVRIIIENPAKAAQLLEDAEFNLAKAKKNTEVTAILITKENPISKITKIIGEHALNIEYAYSSAVHYEDKFVLILRLSEAEKAEKTLNDNKITILTLEDIKKHFQ
jgi:hypothetical protein